MRFHIKKPCLNCPFLNDKPYQFGWLGQGRAEEIIHAICHEDNHFICHETLEMPKRKQASCAGSMILLEKLENPNQAMRMAERIGWYDRFKLDMNAPVFDTGEAFIKWHSGIEDNELAESEVNESK